MNKLSKYMSIEIFMILLYSTILQKYYIYKIPIYSKFSYVINAFIKQLYIMRERGYMQWFMVGVIIVITLMLYTIYFFTKLRYNNTIEALIVAVINFIFLLIILSIYADPILVCIAITLAVGVVFVYTN